jgi:hypothetical protein
MVLPPLCICGPFRTRDAATLVFPRRNRAVAIRQHLEATQANFPVRAE